MQCNTMQCICRVQSSYSRAIVVKSTTNLQCTEHVLEHRDDLQHPGREGESESESERKRGRARRRARARARARGGGGGGASVL